MVPVRIGLLGLGTVGGGVITLLRRNAREIERRLGGALHVTHAAVQDSSKPRDLPLEGITVTTNPEAICTDPEIDIVVELIGGIEPAHRLIRLALAQGKPVVTANKALLAEYGNELFHYAEAQGVDLAFEAAVAGGIPIIKALRESLAGNQIENLEGIINGTANYILSQMRTIGLDFESALREAQQQGYAESDPTFDIDGIDAAHKLALMVAVAFGAPIQYESLHTEGLRSLTRADIDYAEEFGYRVKLLAIGKHTSHGIEHRVHPTLVPQATLLADVEGVFNAVKVRSDAAGSTLYYGPGAGAKPTASAILADLMDVTRTLDAPPRGRVPYLGFRHASDSAPRWIPIEEIETEYYLRMQALDRPGVLAQVTRILSEEGISIEALRQKEPRPGDPDVPVVLLTHLTKEKAMQRARQAIDALDEITQPTQLLRLEER